MWLLSSGPMAARFGQPAHFRAHDDAICGTAQGIRVCHCRCAAAGALSGGNCPGKTIRRRRAGDRSRINPPRAVCEAVKKLRAAGLRFSPPSSTSKHEQRTATSATRVHTPARYRSSFYGFRISPAGQNPPFPKSRHGMLGGFSSVREGLQSRFWLISIAAAAA